MDPAKIEKTHPFLFQYQKLLRTSTLEINKLKNDLSIEVLKHTVSEWKYVPKELYDLIYSFL